MTLDITELVSRGDSEPPRFSALLHEWTDQDAQAKVAGHLMEQSGETSLVRGLGRFTASQAFEQITLDARVQLALPGRYRIEYEHDRAPKAQSIVCDAERLWTVYADRVAVKEARPPRLGLSQVADLSWLLDGTELANEGSRSVAGRDAVLISAVPAGNFIAGHGPLSNAPVTANRVETAIDVELGIALSQRWHYDDRLIMRAELTEVGADVDDGAFQYEAPPGIRVLTDPNPMAQTGLSAGALTWHLALGTTKALIDVGKWLVRDGGRDAK